MRGLTTLEKIVYAVLAAVVSVFLAFGSEGIGKGHVGGTPGMLVASKLVPTLPVPNQLQNLGETILVGLTVDSALYFVLICGVLVITGKLRDRYNN
jgi:hypothetical protein